MSPLLRKIQATRGIQSILHWTTREASKIRITKRKTVRPLEIKPQTSLWAKSISALWRSKTVVSTKHPSNLKRLTAGNPSHPKASSKDLSVRDPKAVANASSGSRIWFWPLRRTVWPRNLVWLTLMHLESRRVWKQSSTRRSATTTQSTATWSASPRPQRKRCSRHTSTS